MTFRNSVSRRKERACKTETSHFDRTGMISVMPVFAFLKLTRAENESAYGENPTRNEKETISLK
jgi:hypothetical protein